MKILVVADGFEATHLEESRSWLGELTACLAQRGHRVTALCTRSPEPWQTGEDPVGVTPWRPSADALDSTLRCALDLQPDIVHLASEGPWSRAAVDMLLASPLVLDAHGLWPVCANGDLVRRPQFVGCPHHHLHEDCGACAGLSRLGAMTARAPLGAGAHAVIAHAGWLRDRLASGLARTIDWVPLGVDTSVFRPDPRPPLSPEVAALSADRSCPRVLLAPRSPVSRGAPRASDLLVALNARVPGIQLVVAGCESDDPDSALTLLAEAREMGLASQVRFIHAVPRGDLPALLASCQLVLSPAPLPSSSGLLFVQALATGVPVVAHASGPVTELIEHGKTGLQVAAMEIGPFAHAAALLLRDPDARAAYGEDARLAAIERFDLERVLFGHEEIYRRVEHASGALPHTRSERVPPRRTAA